MTLTLRYNDLTGSGSAAQNATQLRDRLNNYANALAGSQVAGRLGNTPAGGTSGHLGTAHARVTQKVNQLRTRAQQAGDIATRITNLRNTAHSVDARVVAMFRPPLARRVSRILGFGARFAGAVARAGAGIVRGLFQGAVAGIRALGAFVGGALRTIGNAFATIGRAIRDWYRYRAPDWVRRAGGFIASVARVVVIVAGVVLAVVAIVALAVFALPLLLKAIVVVAKVAKTIAIKVGAKMKIKAAVKASTKMALKKATKKAAKIAAKQSAKKLTLGKKLAKVGKVAGKVGKGFKKTKKGADGFLHLNDLSREHLGIGFNLPKKSTDFIRNIGGEDNRFFNITANIIDIGFLVHGVATLPQNFNKLSDRISGFGDLTSRMAQFRSGAMILHGTIDLTSTINSSIRGSFNLGQSIGNVIVNINLPANLTNFTMKNFVTIAPMPVRVFIPQIALPSLTPPSVSIPSFARAA